MSVEVLKTKRAAKLEIAPEAKRYVPCTSARERQAYQAAHAILALTEYGETNLACPGARRTRQVDRIAQVILEVL